MAVYLKTFIDVCETLKTLVTIYIFIWILRISSKIYEQEMEKCTFENNVPLKIVKNQT